MTSKPPGKPEATPQPNGELGSLPSADEANVLERASINALNAALPVERFITRTEPTDFGVDLSIEVRASGRATNCRSQVQLKARTGTVANADGSLSLSVDVKNLSYILNGPCPIYVLFRSEARELVFAYARDEEQRLSASEPSWRESKSVTIRMTHRFDEGGLHDLKKRILDEARRYDAVQIALGSLVSRSGQRVEVANAGDAIRVTGPDEAFSQLQSHGTALVMAGFSSRVLELCALIPNSRIRESRCLLFVKGYAEVSNHTYLAAVGSLRAAKLANGALSPTDSKLLDLLLISAEHAVGYLTSEQFQARCLAWRDDAPEYLAAQYDLGRIWRRRVEVDPLQAQSFADDLLTVLRRVAALREGPPALYQQARILELFVRAQECAIGLSLAQAQVRHGRSDAVDGGLSARARVAASEAVLGGWRAEFDGLLGEIRDAGNGPLYCEALHARCICEFLIFVPSYVSVVRTSPPSFDEVRPMLAKVQETQRLARHFDQLDIELRARLLESDLASLAGEADVARAIAAEVVGHAQAMQLSDIETSATKALTSSKYEELRREAELFLERGDVWAAGGLSDADLDDMARTNLAADGAPEDLLPLYRDAAEANRAAGRLQREWCKHIDIEYRPLSADPRDRPEWRASCTLLARASAFPAQDWSAVLNAFKCANCTACAQRELRPRE